MKRLLLSTLAGFALASSSAFAADLVPLKAPYAPPPPPVSWTGCYLDGGIGYGMWNQDEYTNLPTGPTSTTVINGGRGWLGRFGGGCDYQVGGGFSHWVIGAFADYDVMSLKGTNSPPDTVGGGVFLAPGSGSEEESGAWYAGGRIGYLITPTLLSYFDGGYTETHFDQVNLGPTTVGGGPIGVSMPAETYHGWFLGGGTEYALNFSWLPIHGLFWRNEYRYGEYRAQNLEFFSTASGVPTGLYENEKKEVQTITSSLVWRFNWGGPIATRY